MQSFVDYPSFSSYVEFGGYESWVPLFLCLFAGFTRFYRLDRPGGVVFDESHFGKFTGWYTKSEYYFDIHPPFARVVLWAVGYVTGYDPEKCDFEQINAQYGPGCHYTVLRCVAAVHSTATCVLMYYLARRWGASMWGGILASSLIIFDMLNTIEGRLILLDTQLEFWLLAALYIATCWWQRFDEHHAALAPAASAASSSAATADAVVASSPSPPSASAAALVEGGAAAASASAAAAAAAGGGGGQPEVAWGASLWQWFWAPAPSHRRSVPATVTDKKIGGGVVSEAATAAAAVAAAQTLSPFQRLVWAAAVGIVCGNCFSIKMTGLVTPFIVAVESCFALFILRRAIPFADMLIVLFAGAATYTFWFACHFALMTRWNEMAAEFMTPNYQASLIGSPTFNPAARWEGFWSTFITLNIRMVVHNANILAPHHWQTRWYEWVLNTRGLAYYGTDTHLGYSDNVYLIGHPLIHWGVLACMALYGALGVIYLRWQGEPTHKRDLERAWKPILAQCSFCLVAYCVNLAPYLAAVERSTFIYHYMPSLLYAQLLATRIIEACVGKRHIELTTKLLFLILGVTWLFFSPWWYAFPMTQEGHERRRWLPRWN